MIYFFVDNFFTFCLFLQIPKCHFPNFIGRPKHTRVMAGALEGDLFVGPKAQEHRGLLSIRYPMEHGIVTDWNDMERIWQYIYSKDQLQTFSEEHPVLLTEAPLNPRRNREKAAEIFFETFNVPALFLSMQVSNHIMKARKSECSAFLDESIKLLNSNIFGKKIVVPSFLKSVTTSYDRMTGM